MGAPMREPPPNDPWTWETGHLIYENPWISLIHRTGRRPDGAPGIYGIVRFHNRAIAVVPLFADGRMVLVGQFRVPLNRWSWEVPEGGGPLEEPPLDAARRELAEETGLHAREWREILCSDISNSVTDETGVIFLATGLQQGRAEPEGSEQLSLRCVHFRTALAMVDTGVIRDALSQLALLRVWRMAVQGELPPELCAALLADPGTEAGVPDPCYP